MAQDIDYEALAAKHGGAPDYEALAATHGGNEAGSSSTPSGVNMGLPLAALAAAEPTIAGWATKLAANPDAWKTGGAMVGRIAAGGAALTATGSKLLAGDIPGAATALMATGPAMWYGGKAGWFTGKAAQQMATPVANALNKVAPFLEHTGPLLGAMSAEGSALQGLNSPASIASLVQHLSPEQRDEMMAFYQARHQPEIVQAILAASKAGGTR
jgi:hypothetical protein